MTATCTSQVRTERLEDFWADLRAAEGRRDPVVRQALFRALVHRGTVLATAAGFTPGGVESPATGLVTVITPVGPAWNREYLSAAARSLAAQDASLEWVLSCDRSDPLDVGLVAREGVGGRVAVRVVSSRSPGTAQARNSALAAASGDWVYCLDADDWVLPGGVGKLLRAAEGHLWSAGLSHDVDASGKTILYRPPAEFTPWRSVIPRGDFLRVAGRVGTYPVLCSGATMLRAGLVRVLGGWDEELGTVSEDVSLIAAVSACAVGGWADSDVLAYRKHGGSITAAPGDGAVERKAARRVLDRASMSAKAVGFAASCLTC